MKLRYLLPILALLVAVTVHAAAFKKVTVAELQDLLNSLHNNGKSDEQVASQLRALELSEALPATTMHAFTKLSPGPLSTEQLFVVEARSAMLAPPPAEIPSTAAPDAAAQQAMLAKAHDYADKTYAQLPPLKAARMTARFQDGTQTISSYTGAALQTSDTADPVQDESRIAIRLANTHTDTVHIHKGLTEQAPKERVKWGPNGLVTSTLPPTPLPELLNEIITSGNPTFLRWQVIRGKAAAVFSFTLDKKQSHYGLNYCCFPATSSVGNVLYSGSAAHPVNNGNLSTVSEWVNFAARPIPYHGELYLDPTTGIVLRTITDTSFKASDPVHSEQLRIDYGAVLVGKQPYILPIRTFTLAEIVPNADSFAAHYAVRHDVVTEDFKDFAPAEK